jgi:hypothetical protein
MQSLRGRAPVFAAALLAASLAFGGTAGAQTTTAPAKKEEFKPSVGQEGKDVIWVPTPQALVDRMLQMANTKPNDYVVDLGAGDGRTVITAAKKFGARALGVEYNPEMVELAKRAAEKEGVAGKAQFIRADIFQTDFSEATVLTLYLLPSLNVKLRPTILNMKPGTRVVSHAFDMGEWKPDQTDTAEGRTAHLWIVPAKVGGTWRWDMTGGGARTYEATLQQEFQTFGGVARADSKPLKLTNGTLAGDVVSFTVGEGDARRDFTGRVNGNRIEGTMKAAGNATPAKWTATRVGDGK